MIKAILSLYRPSFVGAIVYMLQATEYQILPYLKWFWRTKDFSTVMHRKVLVNTRAARLLKLFVGIGMLTQTVAAIYLAAVSITHGWGNPGVAWAITLYTGTPLVWAHLVVLPLLIGRWFIIQPYYWLKIRTTKVIFSEHRGVKIAVAGSYGKTTMKEMLLAVLSEGKKVAATPANKNVAISHAQFAKVLKGDEEVLIIEFGEGAPGDVARFCYTIQPNIGIITGLAPAHLDKYKTLERAGRDIFYLAKYLGDKNIYVNGENQVLKPFVQKSHSLYSSQQAAGWTISDVKVNIDGLTFVMKKGGQTLKLKSKLLGRHQVGPLALVAALANRLGLNASQIEKGISKIESFEHRMEPRRVAGAWILDDTYNGNIEGLKAGLELLKELPAARKIYVTPGLVDQGENSAAIHQELGRAIAGASPDIVVLMQHSVTPDIQNGLEAGGYKGELIIEDDPLGFYNNLDQFIASGDIVMLQNDWPDQYS